MATLAGCEQPEDKPSGGPVSPAPSGTTGHTGLPPAVDSDGDGYLDEEDCGPDDPLVYPDAIERCNGIDDSCDGQPDPFIEQDGDNDGALWCEDCDDTSADSYPGAPDAFGDGLDTDCDGTDGQGTALPEAFYAGETLWRTAGLSLAGGDVDGDGCDDLLIGEPGGYAGNWPMDDAATLGAGCYPWSEGLETYVADDGSYTGYNVDLAHGLIAVHQAGWFAGSGRLSVFDETFGPNAEPILEIRGEPYTDQRVDSIAILGEPAEWFLIGRQGGLDFNSVFYLVSADRRGVVDFQYEDPDLVLETATQNYHVSLYPGDVGDRDGDGHTDIGIVGEMGLRPARFFPEVVGGHVDDAPEIWTEDDPGSLPDQLIRSGGDLDGDGRSDAVLSSLFAAGEQIESGRAYIIPWRGPGEWSLETDAPTRLDGELTEDWFGLDNEVADVDGDGQNDLVISAPGLFPLTAIPKPGKVMVFRGPLPAGVLTTADAAVVWVAEQPDDHAGTSLSTGDFDGSGHIDIAIGAPFVDRDGVEDVGAVYLLIDPL